MEAISELKETLITACRILDREGMMDELGHFSVRCPEKGGVFINGKVSPGQATEEDIILLDLEGNKLEGDLEAARAWYGKAVALRDDHVAAAESLLRVSARED